MDNDSFNDLDIENLANEFEDIEYNLDEYKPVQYDLAEVSKKKDGVSNFVQNFDAE